MAYITYDGMRIFYREQGEGRPLLILPGNTASSAIHLGELEQFARIHHAVAVDLPGTGQSDRMGVWPEDWWRYSADSEVYLVNDGDHPLMWTRPEAFRGSVAAFLDRTASGESR